ncbi:GNAT family N-acetyltransferase [Limobrevibacterium gyesilva]|nr:GNAT family N-acetyltransferase [Limobrevibacterium gyesilva]
MTQDDLPDVARIADAVHPDHPEDISIFAERLRLHPAGCFVLDGAAGYLVSHPWRALDPPALNHLLGALPAAPDTYYLHDIALLPRARGTGAAAAIVRAIIGHAAAAGLPGVSLIAVGASAPFWEAQGFIALDNPAMAAKLASYGTGSRYMVRDTRRAP